MPRAAIQSRPRGFDVRLDVREFALQAPALGGEVIVRDARVLQGGEDEEALIVAKRDDACRPVSHRCFGRAAIHVDDAGPRITLDVKEDLALGCDHFMPAAGPWFELSAEEYRPFRQVLDPRQEVERTVLRGHQSESMRARVHRSAPECLWLAPRSSQVGEGTEPSPRR